MKNVQIILASRSPRRKALLKQIGVSFTAQESDFQEKKNAGRPTATSVRKMTMENAKGKALNTATKIADGIILGVDTIVFCQGKIIGKPKDSKEAIAILNFLNGKMHQVFSAIALVKKDKDGIQVLTDCEIAKVHFRKSSVEEIKNYVATGEPLDKAGGYGVQEKGAILIRKIDGDFYTIVGLPIVKTLALAKKMGIELI